jgi:hypothetical protein
MPASQPRAARLERVRCAVARLLFRTSLAATEVSTAAAPPGHPWRLLTKSTLDDLSELATSALRPRAADGTPEPKIGRSHWKLALATYLVLSQFVLFLPGIIVYHGPKLKVLQMAGLTEDPVVAPRLRVYVTPTRSNLEPVEASLSVSG